MPASAADTPPTPSERMRELGMLAEENRQLLKRAMRVQRRVLDLVAKAARSSPQGARYGSAGKLSAAGLGAQSFKTRA